MKPSLPKFGALIGFFVLAITIPFSVYVANQTTDTTSLISRADLSGKTMLYLWPAALSIQNCAADALPANCPKQKIEIILDTKSVFVSGTDVVLKYDPAVLTVAKNAIFPGVVDNNYNQLVTIFDYYREGEVNQNTGEIKIKALGKHNGEKAVVATFFVTGKQPGQTKIEIQENALTGGSKVWDVNGNNNILGPVMGAEVTIL